MTKLPRGIKKEPAALLKKSLNSLTLAIEFFNRPSDTGRSDAVLILLDHSFEMLLKAGILHKGDHIRDTDRNNTIGFKACIARARSSPNCLFLSDNEGIVLMIINGLRDASQHHIADVPEEILYLQVQSGVTLARDLLKRLFDMELAAYLPRRVMPISTVALSSIEALFDSTISEVRQLLAPGRRRKREAVALLRPLAIMDRAISSEEGQPSDRELTKLADRFKAGSDWRTVFLGVNLIECVSDHAGPSVSLRITKKGGTPITIVPLESDLASQAPTVALKRVNELDFYNLSSTQMHNHLGITMPRFWALAKHLGLEEDADSFRLFQFGQQKLKRFSQVGLERAQQEVQRLTSEEWDAIWDRHRPRRKSENRGVNR